MGYIYKHKNKREMYPFHLCNIRDAVIFDCSLFGITKLAEFVFSVRALGIKKR